MHALRRRPENLGLLIQFNAAIYHLSSSIIITARTGGTNVRIHVDVYGGEAAARTSNKSEEEQQQQHRTAGSSRSSSSSMPIELLSGSLHVLLRPHNIGIPLERREKSSTHEHTLSATHLCIS